MHARTHARMHARPPVRPPARPHAHARAGMFGAVRSVHGCVAAWKLKLSRWWAALRKSRPCLGLRASKRLRSRCGTSVGTGSEPYTRAPQPLTRNGLAYVPVLPLHIPLREGMRREYRWHVQE